MEGTNALLANLVQTKSIERVLAPIANQVAQLILLNESFENGEVPSGWGHIQHTAQSVNNSAIKLTQLASRMTADSEDQDLLVQMPAACDLLKMAGQAFIAAARLAEDNDFSPHTRRQLIRSAKDVFEGTLKVLLVMDDAEVRKLVKCGRWVLDLVAVISGVTDMKQLVQKFQALTEAVLLLTNLSRRRQQELCNPHQRERLYQALTSLRKWLPLLSTAANTHIKYPGNPQAKSSQEYAVGQVISCVHDVMEAVENRHMTSAVDESLEEAEAQGHFKDTLVKLVSHLSGSTHSMDINDLECGMEYAVRHSMTVASLASDAHRNLLSRNCQRALQQKTLLVNHHKSTNQDSNRVQDANADYEDSCMCLMAELRDLERHVNAAVLELVVVALKETTEPIERLLQAALDTDKGSPGHSHHTGDGDLEVFIEEFHAHSDRMCQVVELVASGTAQGKEVREMRGCLQQLERLDPELVPATLACRQSPEDQAARRHLRMLKVEWCRSLQLMLAAVDDVIDKVAFIRIADAEFAADLEELKCSFEDGTDIITMSTRPVISGALRIAHIASAVVGSSADIKLRNKASIYINQIIKVVASVKSAARGLQQQRVQKLPSLSKRCDVLQRCISKLRRLLVPSDGDGDYRNTPYLDNMEKESDVLDEELDDNPFAAIKPMSSQVSIGTDKPTGNHGNQQADPQALHDYVLELAHPRLKELSRQFVTSAVGGRQKEVDLLSNQILSECNHLTELANMMVDAGCENKKKMSELSSEALQLTPHILDKACHVIDLDTYEMEPLYQTGERWAAMLSSLEELIDQVLGEWKKLADKVVDAAKLSNHRLLAVQVRYLQDHVKAVHEYVNVASQTVETSDVVAVETSHLLKDAVDDLDNVVAMLGTLADLTANSASDEDRVHLTKVGREWASRVYCITTTLQRMCLDATHKLRGPLLLPDWTSHSDVKKFVRRMTDENLRWKELFGAALLDPSADVHLRRASASLEQLDVVTSRMDECSMVLSPAVSTGVDRYYVPCRMLLLYWQWAQTEAQLRQVTELLLLQYYGPTQPLTKTDTGSPAKLAAADALVATVHGSKDKTQRLIPSHCSAEVRSKVMTQFADLEAASLKLREHVRRGVSSSTPVPVEQMAWCRRQWAFSAWNLERELRASSLSSKEVEAMLSDLRSPPSTKNSTFNESSSSPAGPAAAADVLPRNRLRGTPVASSPRTAHRQPDPPTPKSGFPPRSHQRKKPNLSALTAEAEKWEMKNNPIVAVAVEMARQLAAMAEIAQFGDEDAKKENKEELIYAAKAITENGDKLVQFAKILAKYCRDKRSVKDLLYYVDHVPSLATQLNILASVKAATPDDRTAEKMLIHNAEGLMDAINRMLRAAEVASVKSFLEPPSEAHDETEAVVLATEWRQKLDIHRELELNSSLRDSLGLRKVDISSPTPSLGRIQTKMQV